MTLLLILTTADGVHVSFVACVCAPRCVLVVDVVDVEDKYRQPTRSCTDAKSGSLLWHAGDDLGAAHKNQILR